MSEVRVVAAAVIHQGRLLVAQRGPGQSQAGRWELPGGKVEPGETDAEALVRELMEELGIEVVAGPHLAESPFTVGDRRLRLVAMAARWVAGDLRPVEHAALSWVDAAGLWALDWCPADLPLLPAVLAQLDSADRSA
jgi:8-oxo-dGTP diphosphatase